MHQALEGLLAIFCPTTALGGRHHGAGSDFLTTAQLVSELEPNPWLSRLESLFESSRYLGVNTLRWHARPFTTSSPCPITLHTCAHVSLPSSASSPRLCVRLQHIRSLFSELTSWFHGCPPFPSIFPLSERFLLSPSPSSSPRTWGLTYLCRPNSGTSCPA